MQLRALVPLALAALPSLATAAGADNNVEWNGVSHAITFDRDPLCPVDNEAFQVRFQTYRGDLASASVVYTDGSTASVAASVAAQRGPYDIWTATIPVSANTQVRYHIELTDGTDTDYLGASGMSTTAPATNDRWLIDFATLEHAPAGATPVTGGGVVFKVWSPTRSTCHVRGEFNGWGTSDPMTKHGEYFIGRVNSAAPGQMYKYYFNNSTWNSDPRARRLNPTDNYNSYIIDPHTYAWQINDFSPVPHGELVVYQLHVGTFAGRNDPFGATANPSGFRDVGDRAAHLAELGVNAVMLNPCNEFPGDFSGGYNPVSSFAFEWNYGTPDDLKYMVDELHANGIAVMLDIVWNHFSPTDNYLWNFDGTQIYFDNPYQDTPWGAQADFGSQGVRDYFLESVVTVLDEYRMDGYRVDATMYMTDSGLTGQWASGQSLVQALNAMVDSRYEDKWTNAEIYIDSSWVIDTLGFDAQYHNTFKNAVRGVVYDAASGSSNMSALAAAIDGTGGSFQSAAFNYFQLHDDAWPSNGHQRAVRDIDTTAPYDDEFASGRTKVGEGVTLLAQGTPAILQGDEWLEDDGWETTKIDWSHKTTYAHIFQYYRDVIALRTTQPAFFATSGAWVYHVNDGADVIAFERFETGGKSFVVVVNMRNNDYTGYRIGLPRGGEWGVAINSEASAYGGDDFGTAGAFTAEAISFDGMAQSYALNIPGHGMLVLEHEPNASAACSAADVTTTGAGSGDPGYGVPDGAVTGADLQYYVNLYVAQDLGADLTTTGAGAGDPGYGVPDGAVTGADIQFFVNLWVAGCP